MRVWDTCGSDARVPIAVAKPVASPICFWKAVNASAAKASPGFAFASALDQAAASDTVPVIAPASEAAYSVDAFVTASRLFLAWLSAGANRSVTFWAAAAIASRMDTLARADAADDVVLSSSFGFRSAKTWAQCAAALALMTVGSFSLMFGRPVASPPMDPPPPPPRPPPTAPPANPLRS